MPLVRPERLGDDAARGAPPATLANDMSKRDTCHRDGPTWPGNNAARGALPAKRAWKMSPGSVDEVELVQLHACVEEMTLHEPPEP